MKSLWEALKDARTIALISIALFAAVTYFAGQYDEIRLLEYWTLTLVSAAALVYVSLHIGDKRAKPVAIVTFLTAIGFLGLIIFRQNVRYNEYVASYDVAFHNTQSETGEDAIQLGVCVLNPNPFPVFAKVRSLLFNVEELSGSYIPASEPTEIPQYSNLVQVFSDPIELPPMTLISPEGVLRATVEYGRERDNLNKILEIELNASFVRDVNGSMRGFGIQVLGGDAPSNFALSPTRISECRRLGSG